MKACLLMVHLTILPLGSAAFATSGDADIDRVREEALREIGKTIDAGFAKLEEIQRRLITGGMIYKPLAGHAEGSLFLTFTVAGELACGQSAAARAQWERLCRPYAVLPWTIQEFIPAIHGDRPDGVAACLVIHHDFGEPGDIGCFH